MKTKKMLSTALAITVILSLVATIPTAAGTLCCLNCTWTKEAREYRDNYLKCLLAEFVFSKTYDACNTAQKMFIHSYWQDVVQRIDQWQSGLWPVIWVPAPPPPTTDPWLPPPEGICTVNKTEIDTYLLWGGVVWQNASTYPLHHIKWWEGPAQWAGACAFMTQIGYMFDAACGYRYVANYTVIPRPYTQLHVDQYKFFDAANLTCTNFNVSIMVQNVTDLWSAELRLGYNASLIDAVCVYPGNICISQGTEKWLPVSPVTLEFEPCDDPTINNTQTPPGNRTYKYQGIIDFCYVWVAVWLKKPNYFTGTGELLKVGFHIKEAPPREMVTVPENKCLGSVLDLWGTALADHLANPIRHAALDGRYCYSRPQKLIGFPTAVCHVTPAKQVVCQNVTFDATGSDDGGAPPLTYKWDVDSDGSYEITTSSVKTSWHCDTAGVHNVTLTVVNNMSLSDTVLIPQTWECIVPKGARQDLWTSPNRFCNQTTTFVGTGLSTDDPANQYVDALTPDVEITLFVKCTWNDAPRMHVLVAFEILYEWKLIDQSKGFPAGYEPLNECIAYRTAETDKDGICNITFRVPSWCTGLPFGKWLVLASCKIQEIKTVDWIRFDVGYPIWLEKVETDKPKYKYCDTMIITIYAKNIMLVPKHALFIATVYDDCGVPIGQAWNYMLDVPAGAWCHPYHFTVTVTVHVPQWTYVGIGGMVYVSAFTDWPKRCGNAYCPEVSVPVEFYWVP